MAGSEPVTSPDQLKPGHRKAGRIGAIVSAVALLLMLFGNHEGGTEDIWLIGIAVVLLADRHRRRRAAPQRPALLIVGTGHDRRQRTTRYVNQARPASGRA